MIDYNSVISDHLKSKLAYFIFSEIKTFKVCSFRACSPPPCTSDLAPPLSLNHYLRGNFPQKIPEVFNIEFNWCGSALSHPKIIASILKGLYASFQVTLHANMSDLQRYPWNLYLINNVEDTIVFLTPTVFISASSPLQFVWINCTSHFRRETANENK